MEPEAAELRVLGCLIEKQRTTPDAYPLTLNALRLACNQATNREPVVEYDEARVRDAAQRLSRRRWARLASGAGSRTPKYRHLLHEALGLGPAELAVLAVLLLRGTQTPGELRSRTERMHQFADSEDLSATLDGLIARELVARLDRRPGQKEERYEQRLGGGGDVDSVQTEPAGEDGSVHQAVDTAVLSSGAEDDLTRRLGALELEVAQLRHSVARLRAALGED